MEIKNLEKKTLTELKALVYDLMAKSQEVNRDMQIVNQMIGTKEKEPKKE